MTALGLALVGLAPGVVAAVVYWCGRAIDRSQRAREAELRALAESPRARALAKELAEGLERVRVALAGGGRPAVAEPGDVVAEPHIEVLKLRAAKVSTRLYCNGNSDASRVIDNAIKAGDREALLALLQESP